MDNYAIRIEVPEGEVKEILDELTKAQKTIYDCYTRLERMGMVKIVKNEAASCN
ncbi:hypothetical protein QVN85_10225 [Oscillibacter valericigenes]|nr:hypothetical protein [Oscillibacter valericigenes]